MLSFNATGGFGLYRGTLADPRKHRRDDFFQRRVFDDHVFDRVLGQDGGESAGDFGPSMRSLTLGGSTLTSSP